jgi:hypothetical protein
MEATTGMWQSISGIDNPLLVLGFYVLQSQFNFNLKCIHIKTGETICLEYNENLWDIILLLMIFSHSVSLNKSELGVIFYLWWLHTKDKTWLQKFTNLVFFVIFTFHIRNMESIGSTCKYFFTCHIWNMRVLLVSSRVIFSRFRTFYG